MLMCRYEAAASGDGPPSKVAACIVEPVVQGAGGMLFVDPLYQQCLVEVARSRRIPVIFDEVFSGLWRLGRVSAAEILGEVPDIACYAKLLTGKPQFLPHLLASYWVLQYSLVLLLGPAAWVLTALLSCAREGL